MPSEIPDIGHVIHYAYLWWNEHQQGREEGVKERPACVILKSQSDEDTTVLYVLPITHTPPMTPDEGIEIPTATKQRLGLDDRRSWIVTTEYNKFTWVGYDVRMLPSGRYSHGILPQTLIEKVIASFKGHARNKALKAVGRD
jgi:hypothetical protein